MIGQWPMVTDHRISLCVCNLPFRTFDLQSVRPSFESLLFLANDGLFDGLLSDELLFDVDKFDCRCWLTSGDVLFDDSELGEQFSAALTWFVVFIVRPVSSCRLGNWPLLFACWFLIRPFNCACGFDCWWDWFWPWPLKWFPVWLADDVQFNLFTNLSDLSCLPGFIQQREREISLILFAFFTLFNCLETNLNSYSLYTYGTVTSSKMESR